MPSATPRIPLDTYIIDALMPDLVGHDHRASAFVVYLALWRQTHGGRRTFAISLRALAEASGLSKRAVQNALAGLVRRKLVSLKRASRTAVPEYTLHRPWVRRAHPR